MAMLDRLTTWATLIFIAGFAAIMSWGIVDAVRAGEIRGLSKSGSGVLHLLSQDPAGFWAAVMAHLMMTGVVWGVAWWFWATQVRKGKGS